MTCQYLQKVAEVLLAFLALGRLVVLLADLAHHVEEACLVVDALLGRRLVERAAPLGGCEENERQRQALSQIGENAFGK